MSLLFLSLGPFLTLFAAAVMRIIAAAQPESSWTDSRRRVLDWISYFLTAISIFGMLFLTFATGQIGVPGFILIAILAAGILEAEVRVAGARNRARQVEFLWVLTMAVKSGRSLADEIEAYEQGCWGRRHHELVDMAARLREGVPLSEIVVPRGLLPGTSLMPIHVGITSQSLEESLKSTALRFTRQLSEDQSTPHSGNAFIYPAALFPFVLVIIAFMMISIVPKFKRIFNEFGTELPNITVFLISTWELGTHYWFLLAFPLFYIPLAIFGLVTMAEYHGWQVMSQSIMGRWFVRWYSPDVMRSLSRAVSQQIPIDRALMSMATFAGPLNLREKLAWAADEIQGGAPGWQSLQKSGFLNFHETVLLETAQRAGNLPWVLETLATNIERRWSFRVNAILEVLSPLLLIAISIIVGFIVIALFMPLIKMLNDLS